MSAEAIEQYNELVERWNERYSSDAEGQPVQSDDFSESFTERLSTTVLSDESTGQQKVKNTVSALSSFASLSDVPPETSDLTKQELAQLIVLRGREVLTEQ